MLTLLGYGFVGLSGARLLLLAATAALVVTGLHLQRRRSRRRLVSSSWLWTEALGGQSSRVLGGRLPRIAAWLLHLSIALALVAAIGQPRPSAGRSGQRTCVLLVDASASMATLTGGRSRQDEARERGHRWLDGLRVGDRALVVGFARRPVAVGGFSGDPRLLGAALDGVTTREEPGDLEGALGFAAEVLVGAPHAEVFVLTDRWRDFSAASAAAHRPDMAVQIERVGTAADNLAVTGFRLVRQAAEPARIDATISVSSFATRSTRTQLDLLAADGRQLATWTLALAAGGQVERHQLFRSEDELALVASLRAWSPAEGNALALDDCAFAVAPAVPRRRVLVVGSENLYLMGALLSFGRALEVKSIDFPTFIRLRDLQQTADFDAVIFDGVAPAVDAGRYLYLDPTGADSPFPVRGVLRDPLPAEVARSHPLLSGVGLADLNIRDAHRLQTGAQDQVLVASPSAPLLIARERAGLRAVALAFDPRRSDLPLRPSFPLLLANILDWLAGGAPADSSTPSYRPGVTARVPQTARARASEVIGPDGDRSPAIAFGDALEVPVGRAGLYRVVPTDEQGAPFTLAANFDEPGESDTRDRESLARAAVPRGSRAPERISLDGRDAMLIVAGCLAAFEWLSHRQRWSA